VTPENDALADAILQQQITPEQLRYVDTNVWLLCGERGDCGCVGLWVC